MLKFENGKNVSLRSFYEVGLLFIILKIFFLILGIYFLERGEEEEKERERNVLPSVDWYSSIHWATPARAKDFIYLFLERGEVGGERGGKKDQCVAAAHLPPPGDLARSPGTCPGWELKWRPFLFAGQHSIHWATPVRPSFSFSFFFFYF